MTVIKFPTKCEGCGKPESKCVCLEVTHRLLWNAVEQIDLSKGYTLKEFVKEIERKLNDE